MDSTKKKLGYYVHKYGTLGPYTIPRPTDEWYYEYKKRIHSMPKLNKKLIVIAHCNIDKQNDINPRILNRIQNLNKLYKDFQEDELKQKGYQLLFLGTDHKGTRYDIYESKKNHLRFEHWGPQYSAILLETIIYQNPGAYLLTHEFIAALVRDWNLLFNIVLNIQIDSYEGLKQNLKDVKRHILNNETGETYT